MIFDHVLEELVRIDHPDEPMQNRRDELRRPHVPHDVVLAKTVVDREGVFSGTGEKAIKSDVSELRALEGPRVGPAAPG